MALKPAPKVRPRTGKPVSFRLPIETAKRLATLSALLNESQVSVLTKLIDNEYEEQLKIDARAVENARKKS